MPTVKGNLRAAREAIASRDCATVLGLCATILDDDLATLDQRYNALVFQGVALKAQADTDGAHRAFRDAIEIQRNSPLAWQGIVSLYEDCKDEREWEEYEKSLRDLAEVLRGIGDANKFSQTIYKLQKQYEHRKMYLKAAKQMQLRLPGREHASLYPAPDDANNRILAFLESHLQTLTDRLTAENHGRIGAGSLRKVKRDARQLAVESVLPEIEIAYGLVDGAACRHLNFLEECRTLFPENVEWEQKVRDKAYEIVSKRLDAPLAYEYVLMDQDVGSVEELNMSMLDRYVKRYPERELAAFLQVCFFQGDRRRSRLGKVQVPAQLFCWFLMATLAEPKVAVTFAKKALDSLEGRCDRGKMRRALKLVLAESWLDLGDVTQLEDSVNLINELLRVDPEDHKVVLTKGKLLNTIGNFVEAKAVLEPIQEAIDGAKSELGWSELNLGNTGTAEKLLIGITESRRRAIDHYRLGCLYWRNGGEQRTHRDYAFSSFVYSLKLDPTFGLGYTALGDFYNFVDGDAERAQRCYRKGWHFGEWNTAPLSLAELLLSIDDDAASVVESRNILVAITDNDPKRGIAWKRLGILNLQQSRCEQAVSNLHMAIRHGFEDDPECWGALGEAYQEIGRYDSAGRVFERTLELDPTRASTIYRLAQLCVLRGQFDESLRLYEELSGREGWDRAIQYGRAESNFGAGNTALGNNNVPLAMEHFGAAALILTPPRCRAGYKLLGDVLYTMGCLNREGGAILDDSVTEKTTDHFRGQPRTKDLEAVLLKLGLPIDFNKDQPDAFLLAKAAFFHSGTERTAGVWHDIGVVLRRCESFSAAVICLWKSLTLRAQQPEVWAEIGVSLSKCKKRRLSLHCLNKAVLLDPRNPALWTTLGTVQLSGGNVQDALVSFQKARTLDPEHLASSIGMSLYSIMKPESPHAIEEAVRNAVDISHMTPSRKLRRVALLMYAQWAFHSDGAREIVTALQEYLSCGGSDLGRRLLSLAYEKLCLFDLALSYSKDPEDQARIRTALGIPAETSIRDPSVSLAWTLCMQNELESGFEMLDAVKADAGLSPNSNSEIDIFASRVLWSLGEENGAKEQLLESFQRNSQYLPVLATLYAMSIKSQDDEIAQSVLAEFMKWSLDERESNDLGASMDILTSLYLSSRGTASLAIRSLAVAIRRSPTNPTLYNALGYAMMRQHGATLRPSIQAIGNLIGTHDRNSRLSISAMKMRVYSALYGSGDPSLASVEVQKLVRVHPDWAKGWEWIKRLSVSRV